MADVEEVLLYEDFTKEVRGRGLVAGLGFPGEAYGVIVARTFSGELKVIVEEVHSYTEGYAVSRKTVSGPEIAIIRSERFAELVKQFKSLGKEVSQ